MTRLWSLWTLKCLVFLVAIVGCINQSYGSSSDSSDSSDSSESGLAFCTEDANVASWGIDLGTIELDDDIEELEFYTVGDFGVIGCSKKDCIAELALSLASGLNAHQLSNGNSAQFVLNVGDNFYQNGASKYTSYNGETGEDALRQRWQDTFEHLFHYDSLSSLYFYSVLGNHDWDPNERDAFDDGLPVSEWDIGTRTQIDYTSDETVNPDTSKRWCMPSYYYTFAYQLESFSVRFIAIDGVILLPYDDNGCIADPDDGSINDFCRGENIPTQVNELLWLEEVLSTSEEDYIVAFGHYPLVAAGKYGVVTSGTRDFDGDGVFSTLDAKCETKGHAGGFDMFTTRVTDLLQAYDVQLYLAGHEHNLEMFLGNYDNGNGQGTQGMIEAISGTGGKNDGILCATQDDIDEQYNDGNGDRVDWTLLYNEGSIVGFSHTIINENGITNKLIDANDLSVLSEQSVSKARCKFDSDSDDR